MTPVSSEARAELIACISALKTVLSTAPEGLRPGLGRALEVLELRTHATAEAGRKPALVPAAPASAPRQVIPSRITFDDEDLRCPHCRVVVLKHERINLDFDRGGAPEFCPKCGERTGVEPLPIV